MTSHCKREGKRTILTAIFNDSQTASPTMCILCSTRRHTVCTLVGMYAHTRTHVHTYVHVRINTHMPYTQSTSIVNMYEG